MPVIRYFTVTQTREVQVTANTMLDAAKLAAAAFENGQNTDNGIAEPGPDLMGIFGNTTSKIEETDLQVTKRY